jgi:hypothetical protein
MTKKQLQTETLRIRLTQTEKIKLMAYAETHSKTATDVIREYIWRLPHTKL